MTALAERVYWHYGYMVALLDTLRYLGVDGGAGRPIPTVKTETENRNKSSAPSVSEAANVRNVTPTFTERQAKIAEWLRVEKSSQTYLTHEECATYIDAYRSHVLQDAIEKVEARQAICRELIDKSTTDELILIWQQRAKEDREILAVLRGMKG